MLNLYTDEWARPIFGLASDFKSLGRDEREERDYANLSQANKRKLRSVAITKFVGNLFELLYKC